MLLRRYKVQTEPAKEVKVTPEVPTEQTAPAEKPKAKSSRKK